jgi:hypothetical protein
MLAVFSPKTFAMASPIGPSTAMKDLRTATASVTAARRPATHCWKVAVWTNCPIFTATLEMDWNRGWNPCATASERFVRMRFIAPENVWPAPGHEIAQNLPLV